VTILRYRELSDDLADLVNSQRPGRYCHVVIEPDRANVRPSGFEVVVSDVLSADPQGGLVIDSPVDVADTFCDPAREGGPIPFNLPPEQGAPPNQFSYVGP